jgi:hypothetical protein
MNPLKPNPDENGLFRINPVSGQVQVNKKLMDKRPGVYLFNLTVTDSGEEIGDEDLNYDDLTTSIISMLQTNINRSSNCSLRILVKDFNSHLPKFIFPNSTNSTYRVKSVNIFTKQLKLILDG